MKYTVVTTFHEQGLRDYGQRMIDTFEKYWPADVDLVVYAENCTPTVSRSNTYINNIFQSSPACLEFVNRHKNNPEAHGGNGPHIVKWDEKKSFRWDAVRFCYKVFALEHAMSNINSDWIIWIDADTHTHSQVSHSFLEKVCPVDYTVSYLGRQNYHSECGWIAYNKNVADAGNIAQTLANMYKTDNIFNYPEWHDSYLWDVVRTKVDPNNSKCFNLNPMYNAVKGAGHPFIHSVLGSVMDHVKGARKAVGHSKKIEILNHQTNPYWKKIISRV